MPTTGKCFELTCLLVHGYSFGANVGKKSFIQVKHGENVFGCKIITQKIATKNKSKHENLKLLSHPHVVPIHSIYQCKGRMFFMMKWIDGVNVLDYLKTKGMLEESTARTLFFQTVCGLTHIHLMGFAHCNLTCKSLMFETTSKGFDARISGLEFLKPSPDGIEILPTRRKSTEFFYLPPEVIKRVPCDLKKCDVFSLGVVLFMMLNLQTPFQCCDSKELVEEQMSRRYKMRRSNINRLSVECQVMLHTLLEPNHEARWSSQKILQSKWISKFIDKHHGDGN